MNFGPMSTSSGTDAGSITRLGIGQETTRLVAFVLVATTIAGFLLAVLMDQKIRFENAFRYVIARSNSGGDGAV